MADVFFWRCGKCGSVACPAIGDAVVVIPMAAVVLKNRVRHFAPLARQRLLAGVGERRERSNA
jgi:hypothetical protein